MLLNPNADLSAMRFALLLMLIVVVFHCGANVVQAQPGFDELRGLARTRRETPPFKMTLKVKMEFDGVPEVAGAYEIDCNPADGRFRFRDLQKGSCSLFDGEVVMAFDGRHSAVICTRDSDHTEFSYDPRLTGIATLLRPFERLESRTDLISPESIRLVDTTKGGTGSTVHLCVIDKHEQEVHYWIQPAPHHRVIKEEFIVYQDGKNVPLFTDRMSSKFDEACPVKWLPSHVELTSTRDDGSVSRSMKMELSNVRLVPEHPKETFTLSGLGMPVGQPVADLRIKMRIGYWTGTGLSDDLPVIPARKN